MDNNLNNQFNQTDEKISEQAGNSENDTAEKATPKPENSAGPKKHKKRNKIILITLSSIAVVLIAAAAFSAVRFIKTITQTIVISIGEKAEPEKIYADSYLSSLYTVEPYTVDNTQPGDYPVTLCFFGFVRRELTVRVCDTLPPILKLRDVHIIEGLDYTCADFVVFVEDDTGAAYDFAESSPSTDEAGEYTVKITASDSYGNSATEEAILTVWDSSNILSSELNEFEIESSMKEKHPDINEMDLSDIEISTIGEYTLRASSDKAVYIWKVDVVDTTPPEAKAENRCIRLGDRLDPEDFVTELSDYSPCGVEYITEPDFTKKGPQGIKIRASDIYDNSRNITAKLFICDIPTEISLEYGTTSDGMKDMLFSGVDSFKKRYTAVKEPELKVGTYNVQYTSIYGDYAVKVNVTDTTSPVLKVRDVTVFQGDRVNIDSFVTSCEDISGATYAFDTVPDSAKEGTFTVKINAEDPYGNKTTASAKMNVITDRTPPVIYGVSDKKILVGESVSFRNGVYAEDNHDGNLNVNVDSSAVNTNAAGTYPIIYTCTDSSGNKASVTAYLTVNVLDINTVNAIADEILRGIITPSMSQTEKAWAVYSWCTSHISYSTRTSYLMGQYVNGAYSGFNIRSGNCYIYYAVASVMLTRAGIENIEIHRNDPSNPHYWNLVNIDGSWYHFDTCPHYAGHEITSFLLTDADVRAYSEHEVANYYSFDSSLYPATP